MSNSGLSKTKIIVGTAVFSALSLVVSLLEFPIFPTASFLKLDFSSVFILLSGFIFGPISAVVCSIVKELIRFTFSATGGIGELANFIVTAGLYLLPTILYRYKKGVKTVIVTLIISSLTATGLALLSNRFILFPFYFFEQAQTFFNEFLPFIIAFNLIKSFSVSILTVFLYKRVVGLIRRI